MVSFVRANIAIVLAPRPAADVDESMKLLKLVYPVDDKGSFLYRDGAECRRVKTSLCENVESIVESISLVPSENGKIKHHCFVQVGAPDHRSGH